MPYVLDASVAASWCFQDEHDLAAEAAFELLDQDRAVVPLLWWFEIRNVLLSGVRRNRLTAEYVAWFLSRLEQCPIELAGLPNEHAVLRIAREHRLSFYDAAYLELAVHENLALATLDADLVSAARKEGVRLIGS